MGIFDDMFGDVFGGSSHSDDSRQPSGGLMDSLFGGFSPTGHVGGYSSGGDAIDSLLSGYRVEEPTGGGRSGGFFGGYRAGERSGYEEPILPTASQAVGYGGARFPAQGGADKSQMIDGVVHDPTLGMTGTPAQLYDYCVANGIDPSFLVERYNKRKF